MTTTILTSKITTITTSITTIDQKIYKSNFTSKIRIFPGDPTGSPDDFFLRDYLNFKENL